MSEQTPPESVIGKKSVADLTDAEIAALSESDVNRFQLKNIVDNTEETKKSNRSQLQQNVNDVRDRKLNANVGLQKAWGEALFTGAGILASFTSQGAQRGMKPIIDGLKSVFAMYMSIRDQNLNKFLSEKQEVGVEMKLISAGVHPETGQPLSPEDQASLIEAMQPRLIRYGLASSVDPQMSPEEVKKAAAEGAESGANLPKNNMKFTA